ncbi:UDP-glucuronate 4-epimerase [Methylobacterium sp. 190mf]|uniref:SDR family NAD(P)-dependent oxidoreductase n=1 Tax=Methylobacterium sp. 190mf TaxID=1761798 RepID=UPI00089E8E34|nr:SDR family NAD(P)-dependent oxidoreductase [Methylobacterium sp. 190mf]SEF39033.1 UDP-glucuronate 4-epimerase [Methylobacterium sp. 190mf]
MSSILVTGAAGFIGYHLCLNLTKIGHEVIAIDSFTDYYEAGLKEARSQQLKQLAGLTVRHLDVADQEALKMLVNESGVERVVHLAAQAGVRYSIQQPFAYQHANLLGHLSILEACRHAPNIKHLVYASSSSVYGNRTVSDTAFTETDLVDNPVSLYAATKRSGELMSSTYAHLYGLAQTGLRFFTVYGPWGRPDMAYFSFTRRILRGEEIEIYGNGQMSRDFTYIDDIVTGIVAILDNPPPNGGHRILNIGANKPQSLADFVDAIESACGRTARRVIRPMQSGDVTTTWADVSRLEALTGYRPQTNLKAGIDTFVAWYRSRYDEDGTVRRELGEPLA